MEAQGSKVVRAGDLELKFLITDSAATVFECVIPPGARVPVPHFHRDVDETVYGLSGVATVTVDGAPHELGQGDAVFIPRGAVHHHANLHQGDARFLAVLTPGSIGRRYFEEIAEVINVPGKPDLAKAKEVMLRHGLVPA